MSTSKYESDFAIGEFAIIDKTDIKCLIVGVSFRKQYVIGSSTDASLVTEYDCRWFINGEEKSAWIAEWRLSYV